MKLCKLSLGMREVVAVKTQTNAITVLIIIEVVFFFLITVLLWHTCSKIILRKKGVDKNSV